VFKLVPRKTVTSIAAGKIDVGSKVREPPCGTYPLQALGHLLSQTEHSFPLERCSKNTKDPADPLRVERLRENLADC
jgi:hypothetical protein